ncbi:MAG: hypothetical protein HRU11_12815 [Parvularculaceae bacterium]|nr:hypothetical protein [Parvularculaceae bacterium]
MILRRLTEHVRAQNWFAVAIDFVIVVIGVFMGLQVQEWSTERAERAHLDSQLSSLRTELILSREYFEDRKQYYRDRLSAAQELRSRLAGEGP